MGKRTGRSVLQLLHPVTGGWWRWGATATAAAQLDRRRRVQPHDAARHSGGPGGRAVELRDHAAEARPGQRRGAAGYTVQAVRERCDCQELRQGIDRFLQHGEAVER